MMFESIVNRRKSYNDILNKMGAQEKRILVCFGFNPPLDNWYKIKNYTGINQDSVKRAISNLSTDEISVDGKMIRNYKKTLIEIGSDRNPETGKSITRYRKMTQQEIDEFHNNFQESIF